MADEDTAHRTGDYDGLYRNYIDLLKQVDHLSTLREIGLAINSSIEFDEVLPTIANVVHGALDIRRLTLFQLEPDLELAKPVVAKFGRDLITRERLEEEGTLLEGSPIGDAVRTRMPVLLNSEHQCAAYVPLIANGLPLGVMRLEDRGDGAPFTHEDAALFQTIGSMIAVAINNAQLYTLAVIDGLTGLYVRRYFDLRMAEEMEQARRYGRAFSLLMLDIDHFKKFNDTHGHQTGDAVLTQFAQLLRDNTRKSDICCRYGGEEMGVILTETEMNEAALLANKLCDTIRNHEFIGTSNQTLCVTASIGATQYHDDFEAPDDMIKIADEALYKAKELGRNRVELARI